MALHVWSGLSDNGQDKMQRGRQLGGAPGQPGGGGGLTAGQQRGEVAAAVAEAVAEAVAVAEEHGGIGQTRRPKGSSWGRGVFL